MNSTGPIGRVRARLNYANVVATLALFLALGGVSYAATSLPKNSVTSKSIKKNAVTNPKIKRAAVDSGKIKNKSITGLDIKDGTITAGKINTSGLVAASAGTANDTFNLFRIAPSSNTGVDEATARAAATEIPLISYGSISLYAKCYVETTNNQTHFEVIARTTAAGSALGGGATDSAYYNDALNPGTLEDDRQVTDDETDSADNVDDDSADNAILLGPDAKGLQFDVANFARFGNPLNPLAFLSGNSCSFQLSGVKVG